MSIIQFDNGMKAEFDGTPTQKDVEEVYNKIKQSQPPQQAPKQMPLINQSTGNLAKDTLSAGGDIAVGGMKSFVRGTKDIASGLQSFGKYALGKVGVNTSNLGIKSIDSSTPEGQGVNQLLQPTSRAEQLGGYLETGAELGAGFVASKAPQAIKAGMEAYTAGKEAKATEKVLDYITPKATEVTPTQYKRLLSEGKFTPQTATTPSQYILSDTEKQIALKNKNLINKDPIQTTINIANEVAKKDKQVGDFLSKNNGIFNSGELKNHIIDYMKDVTDVMAPQGQIDTAKQKLVDGFINALKKNDLKSLWEGRKAFDRSIEKVFSGNPTLQKTVKREFRNAIQDYISKRTPDTVYSSAMKDMSELINLEKVVANKASKIRGMSKLQVWIKNNPIKAKILGIVGTGLIGAEAINLGAKSLGD